MHLSLSALSSADHIWKVMAVYIYVYVGADQPHNVVFKCCRDRQGHEKRIFRAQESACGVGTSWSKLRDSVALYQSRELPVRKHVNARLLCNISGQYYAPELVRAAHIVPRTIGLEFGGYVFGLITLLTGGRILIGRPRTPASSPWIGQLPSYR